MDELEKQQTFNKSQNCNLDHLEYVFAVCCKDKLIAIKQITVKL